MAVIEAKAMTDFPAVPPQQQGRGASHQDEPAVQPDGSAAVPDAGPSGQPAGEDIDDEQIRRDASVHNDIGTVNARWAMFGVSAAVNVRRSTGNLEREEVVASLQHYLAPESFDDSLHLLQVRRVVVLTGPEGIGKRAGALKLLTKVTSNSAKIVSLSPASTLLELSEEISFSKGSGYLIQDWIEDGGTKPERRFDADQLLSRLNDAQAFLVITAPQLRWRDHLNGLLVMWKPPDPVDLFNKFLESSMQVLPGQDEIERVREKVRELKDCGEILALAGHMHEGTDCALGSLQASQTAKVGTWFDGRPKLYRVLAVAALAFLHGVPERHFEVFLQQLIRLADSARDWEARKRPPWAAVDDTDLPQRRVDWHKDESLIKIVNNVGLGSDVSAVGERYLAFHTPVMREQVIRHLAQRYGAELWMPMRSWIRELALEMSPEIRIWLALGIAVWARTAPSEVQEEFLIPWSRGQITQRLTAAHVLSWMCLDDTTGPLALRIALRWKGAGEHQAQTAALALGGTLGVRYPGDAVRWLWYLSSRPEPVGRVARSSLTLLIRSCGERGDALAALQRLYRQARREFTDRQGSQRKRSAMTAVVGVLNAARLDSTGPIAAHLLRIQPDCATQLGGLWAYAVGSTPHRTAAIRALGRTLEALEGDRQARDGVTRLGEAVRAALSRDERDALRRDLETALITRASAKPAAKSRELVLVLIEVLAGRAASVPLSSLGKGV